MYTKRYKKNQQNTYIVHVLGYDICSLLKTLLWLKCEKIHDTYPKGDLNENHIDSIELGIIGYLFPLKFKVKMHIMPPTGNQWTKLKRIMLTGWVILYDSKIIWGPPFPWSYGNWIYNYTCNHCLLTLSCEFRISIIMARCIRCNIMWSSLSGTRQVGGL